MVLFWLFWCHVLFWLVYNYIWKLFWYQKWLKYHQLCIFGHHGVNQHDLDHNSTSYILVIFLRKILGFQPKRDTKIKKKSCVCWDESILPGQPWNSNPALMISARAPFVLYTRWVASFKYTHCDVVVRPLTQTFPWNFYFDTYTYPTRQLYERSRCGIIQCGCKQKLLVSCPGGLPICDTW